MNTIHNRKDLLNTGRGFLDDLFWKTKLDNHKIKRYLFLVKEVLTVDDRAFELAHKNLYI